MGLNERIIVAIGEPSIRQSLGGLLTDLGHQIIANVHSPQEAQRLAPQARKAGVRAAVVYGDPTYDGGEFEHGESITNKLREGIPGLFVVGLGTLSVPQYGDVNIELMDHNFADKVQKALQDI